MYWHDLKETIHICTNPYYLVKYIDQFGREDVADCIYKNGKFINLDKNVPEELNNIIAWCPFEEIEIYLCTNELWRPLTEIYSEFGLNNLGVIAFSEVGDTFCRASPAVIHEKHGVRHFVDLEDMNNIIDNEIEGWVDTGDIWSILDKAKEE